MLTTRGAIGRKAGCLLAWLSLILSAPLWAHQHKYTAVTGDARPYIYEEADRLRVDRPGFSAEIVVEAFKRMNTKLSIGTYSFARQMALMESREADIVIGMYESEAPHFRYPQEAIASTKNCFYVRPDSQWRYRTPDDIETITLGMIKGSTFGHPDIDAYLLSPDRNDVVELGGSGTQMVFRLLTMLKLNRIDVFALDMAVLAEYNILSPSKKDYKVSTCFSEVYLYTAFSPYIPGVEALMARFDKAVSSMRKDGSLEAILKRYGIQDWHKG